MKDKNHLVFIIARFFPFQGGAEQNCLQLAKIAKSKGFEVTILTTNASPTDEILKLEDEIEGIKVIRAKRFNQQLNLGFYPNMLQHLINLKPDIVHVQNGPGFIWHDFIILFHRLLFSKTKSMYITTPHGPFLAVKNGNQSTARNLLKVFMQPYFRLVWSRLFDVYIKVNPFQNTWLINYGVPDTKIKLVPNGIPESYIEKEKEFIDSNDVIEITTVGRVSPYKRIQDVISALELVKKNYGTKNFRYCVIGQPNPFIDELDKQTEKADLVEEVIFKTNANNRERDELLERSEIHVLASEWEATGIVLLEAMAKGNALISSRGNEAYPIVIEENKTGFSFEVGNITQLAEILNNLITDTKLRRRLIRNNLENAINFSWESIGDKYINILNQNENNS